MTCACATTPDDCCGYCCCEDAVEADSGPGTGSGSGTTPAPPAPIVARTGEQLYPVQPTPKETKNKGELLVAVTSKPGLQLKNQGEILVPTTVKPSLVLKNQGVQLSPVVTKGPNAEPVGEYIAPTRAVPGMEAVKKGREVKGGSAAPDLTTEDALLLSTVSLDLRREWPGFVAQDQVQPTQYAASSVRGASPLVANTPELSLWLSIIPPSLRAFARG